MAGELNCSTPTFCSTEAEIDTAVTALTLAAATDFLFVIPWKNGALVFSVQRTA